MPIALRIEAARAAIAYEKPKPASIEAKVEGRLTLAQLVNAAAGDKAGCRHDA